MTPFDDNKDMRDVRDDAVIAGRAGTADDAALIDLVMQLRASAATPPPTPSAALQALLANGLPEAADDAPTQVLGPDDVPTQVISLTGSTKIMRVADLNGVPDEYRAQAAASPPPRKPRNVPDRTDDQPTSGGDADVIDLRQRRRGLRRVVWATGTAAGATIALVAGVAAAAVHDGVPFSRLPNEVVDRISTTVSTILDSAGVAPADPAPATSAPHGTTHPGPVPTSVPTQITLPTEIPVPDPIPTQITLPTEIPVPDIPVPDVPVPVIPVPDVPDLPDPPFDPGF